ncbi:hypothetical protein, partial [Mycobacterium avium]|uniref:hypothetical protein n=2 Tax=Mycobacterium avium TaxID=1764 RepID=UPI000A0462CF
MAMHRIRRVVITLVAAAAAMFPVAAFASAPPASADPICGTPGTPPCAGPSPLTPEQQCGLIAWRSMLPCNWLGMQVPAGGLSQLPGVPAGTCMP